MNSGQLPDTEAVNAATAHLDSLDAKHLVGVLIAQQRDAIAAVDAAGKTIALVVERTARSLHGGGRLHYAGSGTSGRLGFLDASEMPPTFGTPVELVCAHIAGGREALTRAIEGAEDDASAAEAELREHFSPNDVLVAISASGGAPYTVRAVELARAAGAWTVAITSSRNSALQRAADTAIVLHTGPEPIAGSTRLKAGTAQKITLNTISTAVMVRLGKVHGNLMVDVVATNDKLRRRARRLVMELAAVDESTASDLLDASFGSVKAAVVARRRNVDAPTARALLERSGGSLRSALDVQE